MQTQSGYPCIRCGRERVVAKTWKEQVTTLSNVAILTHTSMICPDPECQKIVEAGLDVQRKKRDEIRASQVARMAANVLKRKKK